MHKSFEFLIIKLKKIDAVLTFEIALRIILQIALHSY